MKRGKSWVLETDPKTGNGDLVFQRSSDNRGAAQGLPNGNTLMNRMRDVFWKSHLTARSYVNRFELKKMARSSFLRWACLLPVKFLGL